MPTLRFQGGTPVTSSPSIRIAPRCARLKPAIRRSSVDLPHPEGPSSAKNSPGSTTMSMSRSTTFVPNARFTSRASTLTGPFTFASP